MTDKSRQAKPLQDLLDSVAITAVYDSFKQCYLPRCHPATRRVVQGRILGWAQSDEGPTPQKRILWLSGQTGGGKTTIMGTVAHKLKRAGDLAASFFFSSCSGSKERQIKDHFVTTLVYQLIQHKSIGHIKCLRKKVISLIEKDPSILKKCLKEQMEVLVLNPMRDCQRHLKCQSHYHCRLHSHCHSDSNYEPHSDCRSHSACRSHSNPPQAPHIIVVDGLDECGGTSHKGLSDIERHSAQRSRQRDQTEILAVLLDAAKEPACPFRIILASQPEPGIKRFFSSCKSYSFNVVLDDTYNPDADIAVFLTSEFAEIRLRNPQISQVWPGESTIQWLARIASGQFIYATTVIRLMRTPASTPQKQLDLILKHRTTASSNPLEALDELYAQVLKSCPNPLLASQWLKTYSRLGVEGFGPTTAWFWSKLCESSPGEVASLFEHISAVLDVSDLDAPSIARITFYHKSFQDFLADPHRWRTHFQGLDDDVVERWLTGRFDLALEDNSPQVQISDPYYLNVFNAIVPLYRRALAPSHPSPLIGESPKRNKKQKTPAHHPQAFNGLESDVIILVLGDSGSGKSSLLNRLIGWDQLPVKGKAESGGQHVQVATVQCAPVQYAELNNALEGRRIVLVDGRDFDEGDYEGLGRIVQWLNTTYRQGMFTRGILYLHDVSGAPSRWKTRRRNLRLLAQLCGKSALKLISLVSSRWDRVHPDLVEERLRSLEELSRGGGLWAPLVEGGASVRHLRPVYKRGVASSICPPLMMQDPWDPWTIISPFIGDRGSTGLPLLIQDELVNRYLSFERSTIGQTLRIVPKGIPGEVAGVAVDENTGDARLGTPSAHTSKPLERLKKWVQKKLGYSI